MKVKYQCDTCGELYDTINGATVCELIHAREEYLVELECGCCGEGLVQRERRRVPRTLCNM